MLSRLWQRFTYRVERWFVRGAHYRLLLVAVAIGLISVAGGALVRFAGTGFENLGRRSGGPSSGSAIPVIWATTWAS